MKFQNIDSKSRKILRCLCVQLGGRAFEISTRCIFTQAYLDKEGNPVQIIQLKPNNWSGANRLKITYRYDKKNYKMAFYNQRYDSEKRKTFNILVCERDNVVFDELRLRFIQVTDLFIDREISKYYNGENDYEY